MGKNPYFILQSLFILLFFNAWAEALKFLANFAAKNMQKQHAQFLRDSKQVLRSIQESGICLPVTI